MAAFGVVRKNISASDACADQGTICGKGARMHGQLATLPRAHFEQRGVFCESLGVPKAQRSVERAGGEHGFVKAMRCAARYFACMAVSVRQVGDVCVAFGRLIFEGTFAGQNEICLMI